MCPHITTVVWDEAVFCRKARVPGLGSASSILCPYGVCACSWRPHPRSQFFRRRSPDFLPTCFSARTVVLALNSQPHTLSLHSCIWPSLDDLGPAKATETPVWLIPPASCEHGWCSALGVVASNAQEGELPWTSLCLQWLFLEGRQPARNTSCSISAFPLFPISQSDAV